MLAVGPGGGWERGPRREEERSGEGMQGRMAKDHEGEGGT